MNSFSELWLLLPLALRVVVVVVFVGTVAGLWIMATDLWHLFFDEGDSADVDVATLPSRTSRMADAVPAGSGLPALHALPGGDSRPDNGRILRDAVVGRDQIARERRAYLIALQGGKVRF